MSGGRDHRISASKPHTSACAMPCSSPTTTWNSRTTHASHVVRLDERARIRSARLAGRSRPTRCGRARSSDSAPSAAVISVRRGERAAEIPVEQAAHRVDVGIAEHALGDRPVPERRGVTQLDVPPGVDPVVELLRAEHVVPRRGRIAVGLLHAALELRGLVGHVREGIQRPRRRVEPGVETRHLVAFEQAERSGINRRTGASTAGADDDATARAIDSGSSRSTSPCPRRTTAAGSASPSARSRGSAWRRDAGRDVVEGLRVRSSAG